MKNRIAIALLIFLAFTGCGKNSDTAVQNKNTITIGGKVYKTVIIGSQVWTTENYAGPGGYIPPTNNTYGGYYTRSQALTISVPTGWRLPTIADYNKLTSNVTTFKDNDGNYVAFSEATALASTSGWPSRQGTNILGFNGLNSGYYTVRSAQAIFADVHAGFYVTADALPLTNTAHAQYSYQLEPGSAVINHNPSPDDESYSVRFVKNN